MYWDMPGTVSEVSEINKKQFINNESESECGFSDVSCIIHSICFVSGHFCIRRLLRTICKRLK